MKMIVKKKKSIVIILAYLLIHISFETTIFAEESSSDDTTNTEEISAEIEQKVEVIDASSTETVTTRDGEEIPVDRIPEDIREKLYTPEEGEYVHDPFQEDDPVIQDIQRSTTSSSWTWPFNPTWVQNIPHVPAFLNEHASRVQRIGNAYDLYPSVMLAQAIQESAWGRSALAINYNNYFGIKSAGHSGGSVEMPTWEWIIDPSHPNGGYQVTIIAGFRSYSSPDESFRDYANFLKNNPNRYRGGFRDLASSPQHAIRNIHQGVHVGVGGYATDPDYATKVISNINTYDLERLDTGPTVRYRTHIQSKGTLPWVTNGQSSGTNGERLRMESLQIELDDIENSGIEYQSHVQSYGWTNWVRNGQSSGTTGEAKRLEAIRIRLTGQAAENYDIYYRVHSEHFGWLDWAKNEEDAGTAGYGYRLEAIEIQVVHKSQDIGGRTSSPFKQAPTFILYSPHVESHGWQSWFQNGQTGGTIGERKRLEAIRLQFRNREYSGNVRYRTHVQSYGWQNWVSTGAISGTQGERKRLEAIEIELTGEMARQYDIYYRVHVEHNGWLGWAKNGQSAGTEGLARRMEAIEVVLVRKGQQAPGSTSRHFIR